MADFVAVLRKTIDGLGETTPQMRSKVYDKARSTVAAKLAQIDPPPSPAAAERQKKALEDAILHVESQYAPAPKEQDEADELDDFFTSIGEQSSQPKRELPKPPAPKPSAPPPSAPTPSAALPSAPAPSASAPTPSALVVPKTTPAKEVLPSGWAGPVATEPEEENDDSFNFHDPEMTTLAPPVPLQRRRRSSAGLISALVILLIIAGAAYAGWTNRQQLSSRLGIDLPQFARTGAGASHMTASPAKVAAAKPAPAPAPSATSQNKVASQQAAAAKPSAPSAQPAPAAKPAAPAATASSQAAAPPVQKFTQRLLPNGSETDPGPAGGSAGGNAAIGEGKSVAAATTPPPSTPKGNPPPANGAATANNEQIPVGQHAIFYEERTNVSQGSAENGSVVWSLVKESPGGDAPPEPAIRAEATIPGKDVQLRMTIRRNTDKTLPASHIIELIFLTPDHFEGGGIESVLRVAMKDSEQSPGSPLLGIPAKISDGFFLFALNNDKASEATNLNLLRQQSWIDIPIVYKSGRRALITLEKGIPGNKVFDEALKAWAQEPSDSG